MIKCFIRSMLLWRQASPYRSIQDRSHTDGTNKALFYLKCPSRLMQHKHMIFCFVLFFGNVGLFLRHIKMLLQKNVRVLQSDRANRLGTTGFEMNLSNVHVLPTEMIRKAVCRSGIRHMKGMAYGCLVSHLTRFTMFHCRTPIRQTTKRSAP